MTASRTIFDEMAEAFIQRLEADPEIDPVAAKRLRSVILERDFKVESIRNAIRGVNLKKNDQT